MSDLVEKVRAIMNAAKFGEFSNPEQAIVNLVLEAAKLREAVQEMLPVFDDGVYPLIFAQGRRAYEETA